MAETGKQQGERTVELEDVFADLGEELKAEAVKEKGAPPAPRAPAPVQSAGGETAAQILMRQVRERALRRGPYEKPATPPAPAEVPVRPGVGRFLRSRPGERRETMFPDVTVTMPKKK